MFVLIGIPHMEKLSVPVLRATRRSTHRDGVRTLVVGKWQQLSNGFSSRERSPKPRDKPPEA